ncbi:MAG: hypothetical protein AMQ74_01759 [Candidatus Methanofastidiosum methylothiophilum]|uniref:Uncharacterized protein n=1 Tax=Candidatus Methanofastidiosum methylothiophilum TaxID=1705564 RepID=A0A150IP88_9EURY|nr:MAG: hypothetical protein AMQ74_01759 [Candidatus Methanofastidiosum methylthiophilus]
MYRLFAIGIILLSIGAVLEANDTDRTVQEEVVEIQGMRDFNSLSELKIFLLQDPTDWENYKESTNDCDDFARTLVSRAADKGFIISLQLVSPEQYHEYFGKTLSGNHMICSAIVRNKIYFIEPQTDEVEFVSYMD